MIRTLLCAGLLFTTTCVLNLDAAAVESLDQKYRRIKTKLKGKDEAIENVELAVSESGTHFGPGFDPKSPENAYNFADYDEVVEPQVVNLAENWLHGAKPSRQPKTDFQKMVFSGMRFMSDVVPNVPKSFFNYAPEIGEAVYITPTFDPEKHPSIQQFVYEAPIKTVKTDYSVYELPFGVDQLQVRAQQNPKAEGS